MKRTLILVLVLVTALLTATVGGTIAWFTDEVASANNIIKAGTLDVSMNWADGKTDPANTTWTDASEGAIFNYDLWEPGYTEVRHIEINNEGTLAFKYQISIEATGEVSELADVIDVYIMNPAQQIASRTDLTAAPIGTVAEVLETMPAASTGNLAAGESDRITLALKMQESAGNDYMNMDIGSDFAIKLFATQDTVESDSIDDQYDSGAKFPGPIVVTTTEELLDALKSAKGEVVIDATGVTYDITTADHFEISAGVTLKGATINAKYRGGNYVMMAAGAGDSVVFENCSFGNSARSIILGGSAGGPNSVTYNNCTFSGQVITNFVDNLEGVAEFNNCTFTKKASNGYAFTEAMGGTHLFNNCTFDYTGMSQSSMGVLNNASFNVYSESEYWTKAVLTNCTWINCGFRTYGPNSTCIR